MKANYHTHLIYCNHAIGHAEDYIKEAINCGFSELGITDHAPVLECFMTQAEYKHTWSFQPMKIDTVYNKYLPEVRKAKEDYKDKIKIYTGFEIEYLPDSLFFIKKLAKEVDYLNLGVHFFRYKNQILNSYYDINTVTIYGYMNACIEAMETGLFNTLVHPDLFMFSYKDENGERKFDNHCEIITRKIVETAINNNVYLEINANGLKNSVVYSDGKDWLYPEKEFWKIVKEYPECKVLIGADAHDPKHLNNENVKKVEEFAKEIGIEIQNYMEINH